MMRVLLAAIIGAALCLAVVIPVSRVDSLKRNISDLTATNVALLATNAALTSKMEKRAVESAILRVLDKSEGAEKMAYRINTAAAFDNYHALIASVDVTHCPQKFQSAWMDYCAAWRELIDADARQAEAESQARIESQRERKRAANRNLVVAAIAVLGMVHTGGSSLALLHAGEHAAASAMLPGVRRGNDEQVNHESGNYYAEKILDAENEYRKAASEYGIVFHNQL